LLRLAQPGPNQPVVVIMHGIGGMSGARGEGDEWSNYLNQNGISTFFVDSYSGRGLNSPAEVGAKLWSLARVPDAFAALEVLSKHPLIDPKKIVAMGLSHGSMAAIYSNLERFQRSYGTGLQFAAHVSIYGICNVQIQEDEAATRPILFLHGSADSWVNFEPCRDYATRLKKAGKDARMFEYEGADHAFDDPTTPVKKFPDVKTASWCKLRENAGAVLNVSTGKPLAPTDDCWKTGVGIGYQEAATKKAHEDALSFFKEVFK
jgi:dienelactone hydrolase